MAGQKILIVGATGPLGIYICQEALKRGHSIRIYARNPSKVPEDIKGQANVEIIEGQLTNEAALTKAIEGCTAIVSALGPPVSISVFKFKRGTFTKPYSVMIKAARTFGVKRILFLGTPSARVPGDKPPMQLKAFFLFAGTFLNSVYTEIGAMLKTFEDEASDLDWTMYRVGFLSNDEGITKATALVGTEDWNIRTYRPATARWILDQIGVENGEWCRQKPAVYSMKI